MNTKDINTHCEEGRLLIAAIYLIQENIEMFRNTLADDLLIQLKGIADSIDDSVR